MTDDRFFLDIHVVQTLPPSNVNRDDTGSPKTAVYGGVNRARVSSQAWKRAMRRFFLSESEEEVGIRSKDVIRYVADRIVEKDPACSEEKALELAEKIFTKAKIGVKDHKTKALFFLGKKQADQLADAALNNKSEEEVKTILRDNPAVDIALFGRMVADDSSLNEDAAAQVAHAISTHEVQTEFDFYTAVDDLAPEDNAGAGMLGSVEYNSSTLYRYANISMHELVKQLGSKERAIAAAKLFIKAFAISMPTGKSNTFANQTLPQFLMINIRTDRPVNLVTAFENPVKSRRGYVGPSIQRLLEEEVKAEKFVEKPEKSLYLVDAEIEKPEWATEEASMHALLEDFESFASDNL